VPSEVLDVLYASPAVLQYSQGRLLQTEDSVEVTKVASTDLRERYTEKMFTASKFDPRAMFDAVTHLYKHNDSSTDILANATLISRAATPMTSATQAKMKDKETAMSMGQVRHDGWSKVAVGQELDTAEAKQLKNDSAFEHITEYLHSPGFKSTKVLAIDEPMLGNIGGKFYGVAADCITTFGEDQLCVITEFKSGAKPAGVNKMNKWLSRLAEGFQDPYPDEPLARDILQVNMQLQAVRHMPLPGGGGTRKLAGSGHMILYGNPSGKKHGNVTCPCLTKPFSRKFAGPFLITSKRFVQPNWTRMRHETLSMPRGRSLPRELFSPTSPLSQHLMWSWAQMTG
jgi:hypothetical protein